VRISSAPFSFGGFMEKLWAPWRINYVAMPEQDKKGCIFCDKPAVNEDKKNLILYRGKHNFVLMNLFPYNNGHLLIAPYKHTNQLSELTSEEKLELMDLLVLCEKIISEKMSPHGFNIGMNLGQVAGAGVKDHLHFHIVPRWDGDTNFMPIIGEAKVVSEGLRQTWEKLRQGFEALDS